MLKIYTLNNNRVLGTRFDSTVSGVVVGSVVGKEQFVEYIKANAINDLEEVDIGEGYDVMESKLKDEQVIEYEMLVATFKGAKKRAKGFIHNMVFDAMLGKL